MICIHKTCKVPYSGTMASWSSQPHKRLSVVKMNYMHICTVPTTKKWRVTIPASMACAWNHHVAVVDIWKCSSNIEKGRLSRLKATNPCSTLEMVNPRYSGQLFNTHSTDGWEAEKGTTASLYLNELYTRLKILNSEIKSLLRSPA